MQESLLLPFLNPVSAQNAGLFISTYESIHATRVLDSYEILFVLQGELELFEDDRHFTIGKDQALLLFPHRRHGGDAPYRPGLRFFWIHFRIEAACGQEPGHQDEGPPLDVPQLVTVARPDRLAELFHRFIDDQESGDLTRIEASHLVLLMLCELSRKLPRQGRADASRTILAERIHTFIASHFHEPLCTSLLARHLAYNPDYLGRVFNGEKGFTITEAIHRYRIKKARLLLIENRMNINEIATACGYRDAVYFRRMFRRITDMTPIHFRRLYCRIHVNTH